MLASLHTKTTKEKVVTVAPFEYVKSICQKIPLTQVQKDRFKTDYQPWLINRWLVGICPEIINLNMIKNLPKSLHYQLLMVKVKECFPPKMCLKRHKTDEDTKLVMKRYHVGQDEAEYLSNYVGQDEIKKLKKIYKKKK